MISARPYKPVPKTKYYTSRYVITHLEVRRAGLHSLNWKKLVALELKCSANLAPKLAEYINLNFTRKVPITGLL